MVARRETEPRLQQTKIECEEPNAYLCGSSATVFSVEVRTGRGADNEKHRGDSNCCCSLCIPSCRTKCGQRQIQHGARTHGIDARTSETGARWGQEFRAGPKPGRAWGRKGSRTGFCSKQKEIVALGAADVWEEGHLCLPRVPPRQRIRGPGNKHFGCPVAGPAQAPASLIGAHTGSLAASPTRANPVAGRPCRSWPSGNRCLITSAAL